VLEPVVFDGFVEGVVLLPGTPPGLVDEPVPVDGMPVELVLDGDEPVPVGGMPVAPGLVDDGAVPDEPLEPGPTRPPPLDVVPMPVGLPSVPVDTPLPLVSVDGVVPVVPRLVDVPVLPRLPVAVPALPAPLPMLVPAEPTLPAVAEPPALPPPAD